MIMGEPGYVWPPDWSQLIPDVVVALLTGVGIGVGLWLLQVGRENRAERREISHRWDVLKPALLGALSGAHLPPISGGFEVPGRELRALMKPFDDVPFGVWTEVTGDKRFLNVQNLQRAAHELVNEGTGLEKSMRGAAFMAGLFGGQGTKLAFQYLRELICGTKAEHLMRIFKVGETAADRAVEVFGSMRGTENLTSAAKLFASRVRATQRQMDDIVKSFSNTTLPADTSSQ